MRQGSGAGLTKYLSPLAAWSLAFGCAVGWGSFVMPGNTFLPTAGPLGTVIGLLIGTGLMALIGVNYYQLMKRYPDAGGAFTYANKVLGFDHGFLCAWMLIITYISIIWANATAISLFVRYLFGDFFCFGFSYNLAGYRLYFGEALLMTSLLLITGLLCAFTKRLMKWVQLACAVAMLVGVTVCFAAVVAQGGLDKLTPAFAKAQDPAVQVMGVVVLAPWAFIGFESVSHSAAELRFPLKRTLPVIILALITGALVYIMLALCAAMATPDGYADWSAYLAALGNLDGVQCVPTFYAAQQSLGPGGLSLLGVSAFCGIATGLISGFVALSRLLYSVSQNRMAPPRLGRLSQKGVPTFAVLCITIFSALMPLLGRTNWIIDVTTFGAAIVYAYVSVTALITGVREKKRGVMVLGIAGTVVSMAFIFVYMLPNLWPRNRLSTEAYLMLILWSLLGVAVFRLMIHRDRERKLGKSEIVWVILLALIIVVSMVWVHQLIAEESADVATGLASLEGVDPTRAVPKHIERIIDGFVDMITLNVTVQIGLIVCGLGITFSVFSVIKKREQQIEKERLLAEESNRAKSVFLSNMSHDIRTPMNAITGYTTLALREDVSDTVRGYLEKIDISGKHLLSLINDILDMSRIESGKMELDPAPADWEQLLGEAHDIFAVQMESKNLRFTLNSDGVADRYVVCDKPRLLRVLLNLLSNAYKFTPEGGSVTVSLRQTGSADGSGSYELRVADTGIGMSEEFSKKIFEAFEREKTSAVSKIQGTGLGMTITKSLVELMGGTIGLTTEQGKGTEFVIRLQFPLADEKDVVGEESESEKKQVDLTGKKLLLTEDNPINREIAAMILRHEGFEIDIAEDGSVAVEKVAAAAEDEYCAVLMDVQMPVMDGYEATRRIRAMEGRRGQLPIIALSANSFEDDRRAAAEAGMNMHVAKPFQPEELIAAIVSFL